MAGKPRQNKAKKAKTRRRSAASASSTARASRTASRKTPVTLEEARAMVGRPRMRSAARRAFAEGTTPADLGAERMRLAKLRSEEREERKREYEQIMAVMKERGASRPKAAKGPRLRGPAGEAESFKPLQVFAEGDSWFDYPVPLFGGGIIKRLEKKLGVPILNMASAGDEVRFMLGVEQRQRLVQCLKEGCPAGGSWDALLFSGGGNDIVDNPMALWIRDWEPGVEDPVKHIHQARFDAALALVCAGYEDLINLRDALSPTTHLIFHAYDFAIPDGRGICHLGPWLKPTFDLRGYLTQKTASRVVRCMLEQFASALEHFADTHPNVTFINGQGTLSPVSASWHNELHPAKDGYDQFANLFRDKLKELFPARVA